MLENEDEMTMEEYVEALRNALNRNLLKDSTYIMNNKIGTNGYCEWEYENELSTPLEGSLYRLEHIFTILGTAGLATLCLLKDIYTKMNFYNMLYNLYTTCEIDDKFDERYIHLEVLAKYFRFKSQAVPLFYTAMYSEIFVEEFNYREQNKIITKYYSILSELCRKLSKCGSLEEIEDYTLVYDIEDVIMDVLDILPKDLDTYHFNDIELMEEFIKIPSLQFVVDIEAIEKAVEENF